ncbi:hypothetical protein FJV41_42960 [Myxococcus llanfairpwllgwyngyllgogerychwyrndrobwllllantysiliogogogochensis]|uniref:Lipoprotein n=1 Tax=Myxococcus llanfairpwllgwyngyllgogerychwyrndrobwllllantysiliogogogochensis TaxID=2590453 RepID=A0A540WL62_9BACT|nr:hypothetical protein [Myxococcus llanfairpwllgwyngyllgogerychwyrndrobwllllantysiliogogogochensis]TQF09762.1 hypothetical protein FJV41_42960 [Myxococcus llanfairpwllgwyngyllgogerychwyrndrobwllllantysiliogogogochensis]
MLHPPVTRRAWRTALVLVSSLATACGDDPPPPTPDPPQVALTVLEGNSAGTSLKLSVTVSGCEKVATLNMYDRTTFLKAFPYGSGATPVELLASDIPYANPLVGIAASLSLTAEVVCDDGRKNTSLPQSATFFPVARVVEDPQGAQVYSTPLAIDGTGAGMTFLSCAKTTTGGLETMYRHNSAGSGASALQVPTLCNASTVITPRHAVTRKRWVWTPGYGAFAVGDDFKISSRTPIDLEVEDLTVMPNGDAVIRSVPGPIYRITHDTADGLGIGVTRWKYTREISVGDPIGDLVVRSDGRVLAASHIAYSENRSDVIVEELDGGTDSAGGTLQATRIIRQLFTSNTSTPLPVGSFSPDGSILYLGFALPEDKSQVLACVATLDGCEGAASKWATGVLNGQVKQIATYANGNRVAAATTQFVWLLDATTGVIRNRGGRSVDANGALHVKFLLPANPSSDLFFLNGPAAQGQTVTLPVELVGVDQSSGSVAEGRELFRYQVPVSMGAAFDDTGRLWMRTGLKLLQLQPSSQYRSARP